jgi:hypothetical protein
MNIFCTSSLLAWENPNYGCDFSVDKGSFPNDVFAYFESKAIASAVNPRIND